MSFSTKVKEEIGKHVGTSRHCQIAELLGLCLATGEVELLEQGITFILRPENGLIADKICRLMELVFGSEVSWERHAKYIKMEDQQQIDKVLQTLKLSDYVEFLE